VEHENNRLVVTLAGEEPAREAAERLSRVPGIAYLAVAEETTPDLQAIVELGARMMAERRFQTFAVRARRSEKSLPFRSGDIARRLGTRINEQAAAAGNPVKVDLGNPDATCFVEVTPGRALLYGEKISGVGGLPTGSAGRLVCLLSGGYDSAVAAYRMIRRGVRLTFIHFYAPAARAGEDSPPVARELTRVLTRYQGRSQLYLVPFVDVQRSVVVNAAAASSVANSARPSPCATAIGSIDPSIPARKIDGEACNSTSEKRPSNCSPRLRTKRGQLCAPGMISLSAANIWQPLHTPSVNVSGRSRKRWNCSRAPAW
jgi:thiamine biosynthesis protein ThiI